MNHPDKPTMYKNHVLRHNPVRAAILGGFFAAACVAHATDAPPPTGPSAQASTPTGTTEPVKTPAASEDAAKIPATQTERAPANGAQSTKDTVPVLSVDAPAAAIKQDRVPAVSVDPVKPVKPVKPLKLSEPEKAKTPAKPVASEKAGNSVRDINLDTPQQPVLLTPGPKLPPSMSSMALSMLFEPGGAAAAGNRVVSPVSLISAVGLVHAGTTGPSASELSDLVAPQSARHTALQKDIPRLLKQILVESDALTSANRLWLDTSLTKAISPAYLDKANARYAADAALLSFGVKGGQTATDAINQWAATHTKGRIKNLLPPGAVDANTQAVLTNALRFRNAWATTFDPAATAPAPFLGMKQPVQTMRKSMEVGFRVQGGVTLYELAFSSPAFSFRVAMDTAGNTSKAAQVMLGGTDRQAPFAQKSCVVLLPKFTLAPQSQSLKTWLQAQNVNTVFSSKADFSPLLGDKAKLVQLSDVFQSAGIEVQEGGVEAVAATAAVVTKRLATFDPPDVCAVDRPFAFAIVHKASGTPLFVGSVMQP